MSYVVSCCSTVDLSAELLAEKNIPYACFKMIMNGESYDDNFGIDYPLDKMYGEMRNGAAPTTSQVNYERYIEYFKNILEAGNDVLHICLSGGISGDYSTCYGVVKELNEIYDRKIYLVDSLCASGGYGMLVLLAKENQEKGMSVIDNYNWLMGHRLNIHHLFFSTDLTSFIRGGRISKTAGFIGTALKICPLMYVDAEGKLAVLEKIRTKSKAIREVVEQMKQHASSGTEYDGPVIITHADVMEDAQELKELILAEFKNVKDVSIYSVGATIGAHTGPGTTALFFIGDKRAEEK